MKSRELKKRTGQGISLLLFLAIAVIGLWGKVWAEEAVATTPAATPVAAAPASLMGFMNYADFTWVNGNTHEVDFPLAGKVFTPEFLFDSNYCYDFSRANDHNISGSTCTNLSGQVVVEHLGFGGDAYIDNAHLRIMTEFGMYATEVPRDDETPARGSWAVVPGVQYLTEAFGGYHFDVAGTDGINVDLGQFPSYVGLYSFYDSENWTYQASYVSSNTPWFFTGMRVQLFPSDYFKLELWAINGWQTYGIFDEGLGGSGLNYGFEVRAAPNPSLVLISNDYVGPDNADSPNCIKSHTDDSIICKYFDNPKSNGLDKMAFSLTCDAGMQQGPLYVGPSAPLYDSESTVYGGGNGTGFGPSYGPINAPYATVGPSGWVTVGPGNKPGQYAEYFLGAMAYNRMWFAHDTIAFTFGGGWMDNPGRYLALLPVIDGDTAGNYGSDPVATAAFNESPGVPWQAWDYDLSLQIMPNEYLTFGLEYTHRSSSVPYFVGPGGITSTDGWGPGAGTSSINVSTAPGTPNGTYTSYHPDLVTYEDLIVGAIMVHI